MLTNVDHYIINIFGLFRGVGTCADLKLETSHTCLFSSNSKTGKNNRYNNKYIKKNTVGTVLTQI